MARKRAQMPQTEAETTQPINGAPTGDESSVGASDVLMARAQNEMAMLDAHAQYEAELEKMPKKIGEREIIKAAEILQKYKSGKTNLEAKLVSNEEFWKLRQWRYSTVDDGIEDFHPATAWLWSCIQSRYSDAMDSYPTCNFLARQEDDKFEAEKLSQIVPVVLAQNKYEETYSDIAWYMLKQGGCVQGVFWDQSKNNGLGDITVKKVDFINLFWEPGITNIQDSTHVFHTELVDNSLLEQRYPQTKGKLSSGKTVNLAKYLYDDQVDTTQKSVVVDWYYHVEKNGKKTLQYVKFVNQILLYATENEVKQPTRQEIDPQTGMPLIIPTGESLADRGLYDHGLYPFVVASLYPIEGSLCGYGITDIGRDCQVEIDIINKAVTDNAAVGATPRFFIKNDGSVNEEEFKNGHKQLIHVEGSVDETNIRPIDTPQLNGNYISVLQQKIEELKYVTSNQDVNNGGTQSGVTAASAIAALQESAGKNARSSNQVFHRAYRDVCIQIVELIRQFYDVPRSFRIAPDVWVSYSNQGIMPQQQMNAGQDMGFRKPEFDIDVTSEKSNPYKKMERNELALSFYNMGFFNPQMAEQAMCCLEMMDFEHKDDITKIVKNNSMQQQLLLQMEQVALQLAQKYEPQTAEMLGQVILAAGGQQQPIPMGGEVSLDGGNEHPYVERARQEARESTQSD